MASFESTQFVNKILTNIKSRNYMDKEKMHNPGFGGGQISAYNWVRSLSNRISNIGFSLPFSHSCFEV